MSEARIALCVSILSAVISLAGLEVNYWGTSNNVRVQNMLNRPSITPRGVKVVFCKPALRPECPQAPFDQATDMMLNEIYENTGNVQAENVIVNTHMYLDKNEVKNSHEDKPSTIAPHQQFGLGGEVGTNVFHDIVTGHRKLSLRTSIKYDWPGETKLFVTRRFTSQKLNLSLLKTTALFLRFRESLREEESGREAASTAFGFKSRRAAAPSGIHLRNSKTSNCRQFERFAV